MKLGYTLWIAGWLLLLGGIVVIILGIVQGQFWAIGRGLLMVGISAWWLKAGASRIARAKHGESAFKRIEEEEKAEEEHKLKQEKGDEARHWFR
jgi:hypothetical protein